MHVKKGDNVIVTTGKDKGKKGKILRSFPKLNMVLVEGVNLKKAIEKTKSKKSIVEKSFPIHASNVKIEK